MADLSLMSSCPINAKSVLDFAQAQIAKILPTRFNGRFSLAGGCFKSLLHGRPPKDLDLWPGSDDDRVRLLQALQKHGAEVIIEGQFNTLLRHPGMEVNIEVTVKCPRSVKACIAEFDIQLSCIGVEYAEGNIVDTYIFPDLAAGVAAREVRTAPPLSNMPYRLRTLKRLRRYAEELAYTVPPDALASVWHAYAQASLEDQRAMLQLADLDETCVPEPARVQRMFIEGRPQVPCRPFTGDELATLKQTLLDIRTSTSTNGQRPPLAIFLADLPGAGKTAVLAQALRDLGLPPLDHLVNLDMDAIRAFHAQFNHELQGAAMDNLFERRIFTELISWFNDGANAEHVLYKAPDAIVKTVLHQRLDFVLPIHTRASLDFMRHVTEKHDYLPHLIVVQVSVLVAQRRAMGRARTTGRYASAEYIEASQAELSEMLSNASSFVHASHGQVATFDNTADGGGVPPQRLMQMQMARKRKSV